MDSVYKVIEIIGTSTESWEKATKNAIETSKRTVKDLRIAEIIKQDVKIEGGEMLYRTRMNISFKYEQG